MLKRIVVKFGTKELTNGSSRLKKEIFQRIAAQVSLIIKDGTEVIIVSSGAIQAGREKKLDKGKSTDGISKEELAAIGNMDYFPSLWNEAFDLQNKETALFPLTYSEWEEEIKKEDVRKRMINCIKRGDVPIVNENDIVCNKEIESMEKGISENDCLARMVANLVGADGVLFLTYAGGIYDKNPEKNNDAKIRERIVITEKDIAELKEEYNNNHYQSYDLLGTGGIEKKSREAFLCFEREKNRNMKRVAIAGTGNTTIVKFANHEKIRGTEIVL